MFWILFLPGITFSGDMVEHVGFDAISGLSRMVLYDLPAIILVLFFYTHGRPFAARPFAAPSRGDLMWAGVSLAALLGIAGVLSILSSAIAHPAALPTVGAPRGAISWLIMPLASVSTGYLEETYFRAYLLTNFSEAGLGRGRSIAGATALFALSHLYLGPWGVANAALAGVVLSFVFLKTHSVHGLAWAHGLYNALVYATGI